VSHPLCYKNQCSSSSLDLFRRSFIGVIPDIWAAIPVELRMRGADQGWSTVMKLLQTYVCEMPL